MTYKEIMKLRGLRDFFKDLSIEYWSHCTDVDDPLLKEYYKGKNHAYDVAAERIDRIIGDEKDISKER